MHNSQRFLSRTFSSLAWSAVFLTAFIEQNAQANNPFEQRFYRSENRTFVVDTQKNMLAIKAPSQMDSGAIAVAVDMALEKIKNNIHVLRIKTLRKKEGFFALFLDAQLSASELSQLANAISEPLKAYPVLQRETGRAFAFDEVILTAEKGHLDEVIQQVLIKTDGTLLRKSSVPNTALLRVGKSLNFDAVSASAKVKGLSGLRSLEPNLIREYALKSVDMNDPMLQQQWHLSRDGIFDVPGAGQVFAKDAWEKTTGSADVLVAVFDTGIDLQHEDLAENIIGGFDVVDGDNDPSSECSDSQDGADVATSCPNARPFRESHGTAVGGTVAAIGNNGIGVTGVCPGCKLMPVRFIGGRAGSAITTAEAFIRAIDEGAALINNSWGPGASIYFPLSTSEQDAFEYARTHGRNGKGSLILFAAGNDTSDVALDSYASSHLTLAVSASTNLDDFALYSNFGNAIDVAAPSLGGTVEQDNYGIITTDFTGPEGYAEDAYTLTFSGTSAACPVATGVAGLILSAHADLTAEQLRLAMTGSADKITATQVDWVSIVGQDLSVVFAYDENGHSRGFGYGRVNAAAAIEFAAQIGLQGELCTPGANDNVCSQCSAAGRCETPCTKTEQCISGAVCSEGYCRMPLPSPGDIGEACSADCEYCVNAVDTQFQGTSICTQTCDDDSPCPAGFSCRLLEAGGLGICAVGASSIGVPGDGFKCYSSNLNAAVIVNGAEGQPFCSDLCFDDGPGACPYGFHCGTADCICTGEHRGNCFEYTCNETSFAGTGFDLCFADSDFGVTCGHDDDCAGPDYCVGLDAEETDNGNLVAAGRPGTCEPDDRSGCDICTQCGSDDDCTLGTSCFVNSRDAEYGYCTRFCGTTSDCPGNSECVEVFNSIGSSFVCASPERPLDDVYICVDNWQCEVACRDDVPCADGEVCNAGICDVASELTPANAGTDDSTDADAAAVPSTCGCSKTSTAANQAQLLGLALLGLWFSLRKRHTS